MTNKLLGNNDEMKKIEWKGVIYFLVNLILLTGATIFVARNFIQGEEGVSSILFGGLLLLIMGRYIFSEIDGIKIRKSNLSSKRVGGKD